MSMFDVLSKTEKENAKITGTIASVILNKRHALGLSQAEFAKMIGVSQSMISKWENLDYNFTVKNLLELMDKMNVKIDITFDGRSALNTGKSSINLEHFSTSKNNSWQKTQSIFTQNDLILTGGAA